MLFSTDAIPTLVHGPIGATNWDLCTDAELQVPPRTYGIRAGALARSWEVFKASKCKKH